MLERRIREVVNVGGMQFGFMPGGGTTDALFIVRRMQEEYRDIKKSYIRVLWILRRHLLEFHER